MRTFYRIFYVIFIIYFVEKSLKGSKDKGCTMLFLMAAKKRNIGKFSDAIQFSRKLILKLFKNKIQNIFIKFKHS